MASWGSKSPKVRENSMLTVNCSVHRRRVHGTRECGCAVESDSRNGRTAPVAVTTLGTPEGASRAGFGVR